MNNICNQKKSCCCCGRLSHCVFAIGTLNCIALTYCLYKASHYYGWQRQENQLLAFAAQKDQMMTLNFIVVFIALLPRLILFLAMQLTAIGKNQVKWVYCYWQTVSWLMLFGLTIYFIIGHNDLVDKSV